MVLAGGVLASVVGALVPAIKAANMDPVKALRFE
jgi:ABC-type antimicrobial peptide transport system permease subunit